MSVDYFKLADGSQWPNPLSEVEWRLRYAPTRGTELEAASVCEAYRELVSLPARKRNEKIQMIRDAIEAACSGNGASNG